MKNFCCAFDLFSHRYNNAHTHTRLCGRVCLQLGVQLGLQHTAASADSILHFLDFYIFFAPIFWLLFFAHQWGNITTNTQTDTHTHTGARGAVDYCGQRDFYRCAHSLRSNLVFLFSFISRFFMPLFCSAALSHSHREQLIIAAFALAAAAAASLLLLRSSSSL